MSRKNRQSVNMSVKMADDRVFALGGDGTMLVAAGSNKEFKRPRAKKMICLEGGSQDRRERAEDFIAMYARLGIPAKRIGGYAVEVG